ncbi:hypothetical protein, partial [Allomesorhizobium camelthorni]|uniref:hypothetical protein n=1 Tax=Allomesorhizobium camelthorni TaxID=475069 RepID=UPI0019815B58
LPDIRRRQCEVAFILHSGSSILNRQMIGTLMGTFASGRATRAFCSDRFICVSGFGRFDQRGGYQLVPKGAPEAAATKPLLLRCNRTTAARQLE